MFDKLRRPNKERSYKKIFATVLFGIICFSFVFLGLTPHGNNSFNGSGAAAYVNGTPISIADFRERLDYNERQRGQAATGLPAAERNAQAKQIRMRTIEELIDLEVNVQAAKKDGIVAPDSAVRDQIVNIPAFQNEGQFDRTRYDQYLQYTKSSPGEFENKVRAQVIDTQVRQAFFRALKNPDDLGLAEDQMRETKLNIEFIPFKKEDLKSPLASDADAQAFVATPDGEKKAREYFDSHKSEFVAAPAKVAGAQAAAVTAPDFEKSKLLAAKKAMAAGKQDAVLGAIEEKLKTGQSIDSEMAAQGWKWKETGAVDLSSGAVLPNLGEHPNVLEAAVELREPGKIAPKVVRSGSDLFIVRLKSLTMPQAAAAKPKKNPFSIAPFEALNNWSRAEKEKSQVQRNDALL